MASPKSWVYSKLSGGPESFDDIGVFFEGLIYIVGVRDVFGGLLLFAAEISFGKNIFSSVDILLKHFGEENVVDFDIMRRESVMQETWWEHHVVSVEPECCAILSVELVVISCVLESASSKDHSGDEQVHIEAGVIKRSIRVGEESRSDWSHSSIDTEDSHPEVVDDSEGSVKGVFAVFSLTHLESLEDSTDKTWSLGVSIVDEILKRLSVFKEECLNSLRHFYISKIKL